MRANVCDNSQIAGADTFLGTCQSVLTPAPPAGTRWVAARSQYMAGDPGMRNSHHFEGSASSGTGAQPGRKRWGLRGLT